MCDSGTESDVEPYASSVTPREGDKHSSSFNDYSDRQYFDIDPRNLSYRSSTDLNTSSGRSSSFDTRTGAAGSSKPHKSQDLGWEAIRTVKARDGTVGLSQFRFLQRLGSGDIGSVYLAVLRGTSCFFAVKVMDKRALAERNKLLRSQTEREILEALDHPFLPTLYAHVDERQFSCLVMEFCPGGDLHVLRQRQSFKRFGEDAARFYAAEVLLALEYLHMLGIVYRDLKPENVLVREDGHIMLSDFDLSLKCKNANHIFSRLASVRQPPSKYCAPSTVNCILPGRGCVARCSLHPMAACLPVSLPRIVSIPAAARKTKVPAIRRGPMPELIAEPTNVRSMSFVGTHEYLAPEIILGEGHGSAVDWWTFGIFLFELLYGTTPFKGSHNELTLTNIVTQPLQFPPDQVNVASPSSSAHDLIRGLLVKDPLRRLAAVRGASELKNHPFFHGVNWPLIRCSIPPHIPSPYTLPPASLFPVDDEKEETPRVKSEPRPSLDDSSKQADWIVDGTAAEPLPNFELF